jgi:general secretion pathway protein G
MKRSSHNRPQRGFTLMEVLLVLVILVVLASLAVVAYGPIQRKMKLDAAKSQVGLFKTPLQMYWMQIGAYPTTAQGLEALRTAPGDLPNPAKWDGPYLDSPVPVDHWDHPYQYVSPGTHNHDSYDVWSSGPDGQSGTEDDIGNWNSESSR